ncbi:TadE/TadG family type IV pilus assembly protein [Kordiimonas sp.]|uniref:TadE/TadG family type IV pilus assembly protein n=1 Tax=Kordiimonas sp. TaxID=1970157 RepID=UPI003A8F9F40
MTYNTLSRLCRDETAGTMTLTAVLMPMILGFAGLGVDATGWYMHRRVVQNLSDMAAIEAVHSGHYFEDQALADRVSVFLDDKGYDADTDSVTVNTPPTKGDYAGKDGFMEIVVSRNVPLNFLNAFYGAVSEQPLDVTVAGRAVAGTLIIGTQCIVALDETADRALDFSGTADVVADCGVASNSTSEESIYVGGNASLTADPAMAVGDIAVDGNATLTTNSPLQTFSEPVTDPYKDVTMPPITSCDYTGTVDAGDDMVLTPGRYCGGIDIKGSNVVFEPGTYVIENGNFTANGGAEFSGSEVAFVMTGTTGDQVGYVNINGGATATLSAPTSGDYTGMLFVQDGDATYRGKKNASVFNGGANLQLDGVLYFPSTDLTFTGGAAADPSCLQVFGATVRFTGSSHIGNDDAICTSLDMEISPQVRIQLVE